MREIYVADENADKIPFNLIFIVAMCSFLDFFCMNQIMPNVPFMVGDFFPELDSTEIGYYSGWVTSCYSLGGVFGNLIWGWFSDTYGRKPTLVISLMGTAVFCQVFGLSPNYASAIVSRTLWGLMNSTAGVVRTYIAEVCNSKTIAMGMSVISSAGGLARVIGPLTGGFLSNPEENMPWMVRKIPWLREVRYWIPCFVGSILCFFTAIFTWIAAPETLSKEKAKEARNMKKENANKVVLINEKVKKGEFICRDEQMLLALSRDSYWDLVCNRNVITTCILYAIVCLVQSGQDVMLPLFLINPAEKGGFDFDQTDIGWLYTGIGPIQIIYNLCKLISYMDVYCYSGLIYGILLLLYPLISLLNTSPIPTRWFIVLVSTTLCIFARLINFTTASVLINNSTYSNFRGKVNGFAQVLAALGRFIGPSICSSLFAWSISQDRPFPFDDGLTYYLLAIVTLIASFCVYLLPKNICKPTGSIEKAFQSKEIELSNMDKGEPIINDTDDDKKDVVVVSLQSKPDDIV